MQLRVFTPLSVTPQARVWVSPLVQVSGTVHSLHCPHWPLTQVWVLVPVGSQLTVSEASSTQTSGSSQVPQSVQLPLLQLRDWVPRLFNPQAWFWVSVPVQSVVEH